MGINYIARIDGTVLSNYLYDGHGSVVQMVAEDGTVQNSYTYDEWGNIVSQTGTIDNDINYAGYQYDKETGAYYLMSRMYDPITARFMQEDTYKGQANDPLSLNLYTYCENEPIMQYDPDGHFALSAPVITSIGKAIISSAVSSISNNHKSSSSSSNISEYSSNSSSKSRSYKSGSDLLVQNFLNLIGEKESKSISLKTKVNNTVKSYQNTTTSIETQKINIVPIQRHVCYILYLPGWKNQAKDDQENLTKYYNISKQDVIMIPVSKDTQFADGWNSMGKVNGKDVIIDAVVINTHADKYSLGFATGNLQYNQELVLDSNEVSKLQSKYVPKLIIYSCNAGNLNNNQDNSAAQFSKKVRGGKVLASDGTVDTHAIIDAIIGMKYYSSNDKIFLQECDYVKRPNKGWIIYQNLKNDVDYTISISASLGKGLTLTQMIYKMDNK